MDGNGNIININLWDTVGQEMFREFNLNAMENQQSLITPYDIHDTMIHIMNGNNNLRNYSNKGKSVFKKIDNREFYILIYSFILKEINKSSFLIKISIIIYFL